MIPKTLVLAGLSVAMPLTLGACAQAGTLETGVVPSASFSALQLPGGAFASPRQVAAYYLRPLDMDQPTKMDVGNYSGGAGDRLLLFSAEGLDDPSVSAQQWRILLDQTDSGLRVVGAGVRYRCARSGSDEWTNATCP